MRRLASLLYQTVESTLVVHGILPETFAVTSRLGKGVGVTLQMTHSNEMCQTKGFSLYELSCESSLDRDSTLPS